MNIVLMAGGGGTRLWPVSRKDNPKQFIDLGSGKTLLEHTYERAKLVTEPANIFVATSAQYADRIRELLPDLPATNVFLEPEKRDTAPAFAAVAVRLKILGKGDEPTIFMWADHVFTDEEEFVNDLKKIPELVKSHPDTVVIMGHMPTFPETGFGYIEAGERVDANTDVFKVKAFKEKPDYETAEKYVAAGNYYWNMGYPGVIPSYLLSELRQYQPELMAGVDEFEAALVKGDEKAADSAYGQLQKISIDYALLEKTPNILVVTGDYGWSDVGNWAAVQEIFGRDGDHMPKGHHVHVNSEGNYVYNATEKNVSIIGMKDTIVVVTDDAILVTNKHEAHRVKDVVSRLEEEEKHELL